MALEKEASGTVPGSSCGMTIGTGKGADTLVGAAETRHVSETARKQQVGSAPFSSLLAAAAGKVKTKRQIAATKK